MADRFKNFVEGKWVDSANGTTFEDLNPANKTEVLGSFPRSDHRDVDKAVESAKAHFSTWQRIPAPRRAEILFRAAEILVRRKDELAALITREMGKVLQESLGEVQEAIDVVYYIAGEGRRLWGETTPSELPDRFAMSVRVPLGMVAAITPWTSPLAISTWKLAPALVAGNTVVFKPAEDAPLMAMRLVEILLEAGLPPGVVNLVHGYGEEAGAPLVRHPDVALVSFTGSSEVGREVAIGCAAEHKRVSLEMGGKNPILILEDADLELAVDGVISGGFGTSGQRCSSASRLIVHRKALKEFTERLVARTGELRLGDGMLPTTDVGPVVNEAQLKRVHGYTKIGGKEGAKLLCGGEIYKEGDCRKGFFYTPTIFGDVTPKMKIAQEEIFGPTLAIMPVGGLEEAIEVANASRYGLSSAIYTRDLTKAFRAIEALGAGIISVNATTTGAEVQLPFGGIRQTGNGHREGGRQALDVFTEWKSIYIDYSGKLQRAQIDIEKEEPQGGGAGGRGRRGETHG
ncbi:MAG TPA: aldehyde dehydrogenase family protein [Candidatus Methylomirabilis sp.]|nr:aldehyde dehydrogenase family protein [Candidatus Methylomirabilis sp.]